MRQQLAVLSLLLLPFMGGAQAQEKNYENLKNRTAEMSEQLTMNNTLMTADGRIQDAIEIRSRFKNAHGLIFEIVRSHITDEQKATLIIELTSKTGAFFNELTKPYVDIDPLDYKWEMKRNVVQNIGVGVAEYSKFLALGIWRDVRGLFSSRTAPIWGSDAKRTRLLNKIASDLKGNLKEAEAKVGTPEGKNEMAAILAILEKTNKSEVARYRVFNRITTTFYTGLGVLFFFHPPFEWAISLSFERTTFSPVIAGVNFAIILNSLALSRYSNSGMKFELTAENIKKRIAKFEKKLNFVCDQAYSGKGIPAPKAETE